ncbi:PAS domain-containing protein, partial [Pseudanabaenaceae cyanobacterium LEGE 13415]|nr:PAS domain-containing protein [Pseudanabaenaceae cyanobacterium LEGE 13415]
MMSDEQIRQHFQVIRQQIVARQRDGTEEIDAAIEDLQVIYEQMQTRLEMLEEVEEDLFQQQQYYQDIFQFFPIASLVTDANGLILEANQAIAELLNLPHSYVLRKPLAVFIEERDRTEFRTRLNQLAQSNGTQVWQTRLCSRDRTPVSVELHIAITRNTQGQIEQLRIGVYDLSLLQQTIASTDLSNSPLQVSTHQLPRSLDGLQVLFVDDEADIREFVTTALEAHGIRVRTVASAAAALEELERFRPDVLLSD